MDAHKKAVTSMVLGIVGTALSLWGYFSLASIVLGIIGIVMASNSKKEGEKSGIRTAGLVLSIISLSLGGIVFFALLTLLGAVFSVIGILF